MMKKEILENKNNFPDGFFNQQRPTITMKESLKDVLPIKWKTKKSGKVIVYSTKEQRVV